MLKECVHVPCRFGAASAGPEKSIDMKKNDMITVQEPREARFLNGGATC